MEIGIGRILSMFLRVILLKENYIIDTTANWFNEIIE